MRRNGKKDTTPMKKRAWSGLNKRILSLFLAAAMLFSSADLTAFATEPGVGVETAETPETPEQSEENQEEGAETPGNAEEETETPETAEEETGTPEDSEEVTGEDDENAGESEETPGEDEDEDDTAEEEPEILEEDDAALENTENAAVQVMQDDLQIEAANGLGSLLMSDLKIAAQVEKDERAESYAVSDIEVSGTTARVMFHAAGSCTAVVVIYEEGSEKPYAFGSAVVPAGENQVIVEIEADSLPMYFDAKGYLVDTDSLRPLSREYCTAMYTQAMQEFLAKTADDFGDAPVLNLDEDKSTNFLVLKEGNLLIKEETGENEEDMPVNRLVSYDEASAAYTFANVDDSVKGLKSDDIFVYQYGENDYHIIKVENIELQETEGVTVAVIVAVEEELSAEEVFQHVRIDQVSGTADMSEITQEDCAEGVTYLGREGEAVGYALEGDPSLSLTKDTWDVKWPKDDQEYEDSDVKIKVEAKATFGAKFTLKYYLDWHLAYVDCSAIIEAKVEGTIEAQAEGTIPLVENPLSHMDKDALFVINYSPAIVVGGKFKGEIHTGMSGGLGFKLGTGEMEGGGYGAYNGVKLDVLTIEAEADIYVGIKFDPQLKIKDIFNAELELGAIAGIKASAGIDLSASSDDSYEIHDCGIQCFTINGYIDVPLDGELKLLKWKEYDLSEMLDIGADGSLLNYNFDQGYYCAIHEKNFLWGECPYIKHKTTATVKTTAGESVKGATLTHKGGSRERAVGDSVTTGKDGQASIWLPVGQQIVDASYGGVTKSETVFVDGPKKTNFELDVDLGNVREVCLGAECSAAVTERGSLYTWGDNQYGQIGNGTTIDQTTPVKVLDNVKMLKNDREYGNVGDTYAAITNDGDLYIWGYVRSGEAEYSIFPTLIPLKVLEDVEDIDVYGSYIAAITKEGGLYEWKASDKAGYWDKSEYKMIKVLDDVKSVSMGSGAGSAITEDGSLYTWGYANNQLGYETSSSGWKTPIKILDNVESVNFNGTNGAALTKDGSLYMWGKNTWGQIGNGAITEQITPIKIMDSVKNFRWFNNGTTVAAITEEGVLYGWGQGGYDIFFGEGSQSKPMKLLEHIEEVYDLDVTCCSVLTEDGDLYTWGLYCGRTDGSGKVPGKLLSNVKKAVGCTAVKEDGSLYGWGGHEVEEETSLIVDGHNITYSPLKLLDNIVDVDKGKNHYAAVAEDGSLYMWGKNTEGQIGNGTTEQQYNPVQIDILTTMGAASYALEAYDDTALLTVQTASDVSADSAFFTGLRPNDIHNVYAMMSRDSENPLSSENLLYITQAVSDGNGNLSVSYELREDCENPDIFCIGYTRTDLSSAQVSVPNIDYDGEEHLAEPTVILDGKTLTEGTDYAVYGPCIVTEKGEYTLQIRGIGSYCGTKEVTFRVGEGDDPNEDDPEPDDVLPDDIPSDGVIPDGLWIAGVNENGYRYTSKAIKPEVRVYDYKRLLVEKVDYTIAYKNNTKANDASVEKTAPTITVTGKGNYSGKDTKTFKILPLDISQSTEDNLFEADDMAVVTNKKAQKPVPALLWNGKKLKNKTDYTFTYHKGTYNGTETEELVSVMDAGEYYITLTGKGNFAGTSRIKLTVLPTATDEASVKLISKTTVTKIPNQSYLALRDNGQVTPEVTVKDGKTTLTKDVHYTVSYSNNSKVGTAYAIITGKEEGGYSGTKRVSFKITGVSISKATVEGLSGQTFTYNGADIKPQLKLTVKLNGVSTELKEGTDYSVQWTKISDAGTAAVAFTGINGYTGTLKKTYKIKAYNIAQNQSGSFKAELKSESVPYAKGGAKPELNVTFSKADGSAMTLKEGKDYTVAYRNNTAYNDGSNNNKRAYVTVKGKGNFAGTYAEKLYYQITAQDIGKMTLTAEDKAYQNKKNYYTTKVTVTDLDGKALKAGTDYNKTLEYTYRDDTNLDNGVSRKAGESVDKNDVIPAGTVIRVTATPKGRNYTGTSVSGEYSIKPGSIAGASVSIPKQTYTGRAITLKKEDITVKVKGKKLEPSQYEIVSGSYQNNVKKGTATVTIRGIDNYGGTKKAKFAIKAKGFLWWWKK